MWRKYPFAKKLKLSKTATVIGAVIIVVICLALVKFLQIQAIRSMQMAHEFPPETVTSIIVKEQKWPSILQAIGTVKPIDGLILSADLPGSISAILFESGAQVKKGDLLVQQEISEEQAQLQAAEARKRLAELNLNRLKGLLGKSVASQSDYDAAAAEYVEAEARCKEIQAVIEKKTIRASFDGLTGIRMVNLGEYLRPGDKIVPLQALNPLYVNFSLPQQNLALVKVGDIVRVLPSGKEEKLAEGKITAVDSLIDEATRNFLIQATLENSDGLLRPGMFVRVEVLLPEERSVLAVPATSISYAPYGNFVFITREMKNERTGKIYLGVHQQFVKLGETRGDQVEILSGIQPGDEIVTSGVFKLRPNTAVAINNEIQPGNELMPKVEDR